MEKLYKIRICLVCIHLAEKPMADQLETFDLQKRHLIWY